MSPPTLGEPHPDRPLGRPIRACMTRASRGRKTERWVARNRVSPAWARAVSLSWARASNRRPLASFEVEKRLRSRFRRPPAPWRRPSGGPATTNIHGVTGVTGPQTPNLRRANALWRTTSKRFCDFEAFSTGGKAFGTAWKASPGDGWPIGFGRTSHQPQLPTVPRGLLPSASRPGARKEVCGFILSCARSSVGCARPRRHRQQPLARRQPSIRDAQAGQAIDESPIAKAIRCSRNRRAALRRFLDDGRFESTATGRSAS
jgi:hypothetical protein